MWLWSKVWLWYAWTKGMWHVRRKSIVSRIYYLLIYRWKLNELKVLGVLNESAQFKLIKITMIERTNTGRRIQAKRPCSSLAFVNDVYLVVLDWLRSIIEQPLDLIVNIKSYIVAHTCTSSRLRTCYIYHCLCYHDSRC